MPATRKDLTIEQGATFELVVEVTDNGMPVNLTGATARMQIREDVRSTNVLKSLTSPSGGLVITPATGLITIKMTDEETAVLTWLRGVYDLEVEFSNGEVNRVLRGDVWVSLEVTR